MDIRKGYLPRFFGTYICLIIPVLVVCLLIAGIVSNQVIRKEEEKQLRQLEDTALRLSEAVTDFSDESILLASRYELLRHKLNGSLIDIRKSIELLQLKRSLDSNHTDLFIDFGAEKIYSSAGVTGKTLYISTLLGNREEDKRLCWEILSGDENQVELLFDSDTTGYLICSFHIDKAGEHKRKFNYLLSFEQLGELFRRQEGNQFYEVETKSGRALLFGYDETDKIKVIKRKDWEETKGSTEYVTQEVSIPSVGITLKLHYSENEIRLKSGIYQVQVLNMLLILSAMLLSSVMSWRLSTQRIKEISALEATLKGENSDSISERSVFRHLQSSILNDVNIRKDFEKKIQETSRELREVKAGKLFFGNINDKRELQRFFNELGFEGCPTCFFVGAIATKVQINNEILAPILSNCLMARSKFGEYELMLFLYDLGVLDESRVLRQKIGEEIRAKLREINVNIGMSRVYREENLINVAYEEAVQVLEKLLSGEINENICCWEDSVKDVRFLLPDVTGMDYFVRALKDGDINQAQKWFHYVLSGSDVKGCTAENQEYIRYVVLQALVKYLCEEDINANAHLLMICLNIGVKEERKFVQSIESVIKRCLSDKKKDDFAKMLDYIEKNYGNSNLSYEDVAAVGGVSKTYISKMFRSKLDMSYVEYIVQVRMNKACFFLRNTDYSINDIAKMVGYDNLSSFGRAFKGKFGVTAAEYRKRFSERE